MLTDTAKGAILNQAKSSKKESLWQETQMFLQKAFIFWNIS